jgi:hypothetical protein
MAKSNKTSRKPVTPRPPRWVIWFQHAAPASIFLLYLILWKTSPELVPKLGQEDSWIEWLTVVAFGSACVAFALVGMKRGWREGWFAWGLALFCFLVAGEEVSWGQRLLGFVPPEIFLQKNFQEEANLHNLFNEQMGPQWMLVFVLVGWGLVLPVMRRAGAGKLFERWGVIEPPLVMVPWFILNLALLQYYPLEMTAEYNELIAGVLWLVTALPLLEFSRRTYLAVAAPIVAVAAAAAYQDMQDTFGSPQKLACAEAETRALTAAIEGGASLPGLFVRRSIDYRVHTCINLGFLKPDIVRALDSVTCEGVSTNPNRRRYALDPWGQPYWIFYQRGADRLTGTALFYSFGPNRRYDSPEGSIEGTDDVGTRSRPLRLDTHLPD